MTLEDGARLLAGDAGLDPAMVHRHLAERERDEDGVIDEWRCPGYREGTYACLCNQPQPISGPCPCCKRETQHFLVVPVREAS